MEIRSGEKTGLEKLVKTWIDDKNQELEACFGEGGSVDISTFSNVITRLQSKGFELTQEDVKLNILTPEGYRFTLSGYGVIEAYCENDILPPSYSVMEKRTTTEFSKQVLDQYDVSVKIKSEVILQSEPIDEELGLNKARNANTLNTIIKGWEKQLKAFRLIRRWSCIDKQNERFRFDLSIVHQTARDSNGQYAWKQTYKSQNIMNNPPKYEIEVELLRSDANKDESGTLKNLITGIGEVLRGIQKNTLLIRKDVFEKVIREYSALIKEQTKKFRGVNPETLQVDNIRATPIKDVPNIRNNFNVTDKADGLRVMVFCDENGELFLIDMGLNVYRTGLKSVACAKSLLDAEWITKSRKGEQRQNVYAFDVYYGLGSKDVTRLPFVQSDPTKKNEDRQTKLQEWFEAFNTSQQTNEQATSKKAVLSQFILAQKKFYHGENYKNQNGIFSACDECLKATEGSDYYTDGLILTSNDQPLPEKPNSSFKYQFKWKPAIDNTIDFLVKFQKDDEGNDIIVSEGVDEYKILRLFVAGSDDVIYKDPRAAVLDKRELVKTTSKKKKPVLFTPSDVNDPMASVCYRKLYNRNGTNERYITCEVKTEKDENLNLVGQDSSDMEVIQSMGEPIQDGSIVEMRYDPAQPSPVKRWIPIRVRNDKTERFRSGQIEKTMNSDFVANSNWNSIFNPITRHMITTGDEVPQEKEIQAITSILDDKLEAGRKYYDRKEMKDDKLIVKKLSIFHNHWIKSEVLLKPTLKVREKEGKKTLIDIACGKAGDGYKWIESGAKFVLGIDSAGDNITNKSDGAYRRYINFVKDRGQENVPPMIFVIGDSSVLSLKNGEAGKTEADKDILRALFYDETTKEGFPPRQPVPALVKEWQGSLSKGADVISCMFAIHYFFENKTKFDNLLNNIRESLNIGGYFIGCSFDGSEVYNFLKGTTKDKPRVGQKDKTLIWELNKRYDNEDSDIPIGDGSKEGEPSGFGLKLGVKFISIGLEHDEYLVPFQLLKNKMAEIGCRLLNAEECKELGFTGLTESSRLFKDELAYLATQRNLKKYTLDSPFKEFSELNRWFIFKRTKESGEVKTPIKVPEPTEQVTLAKEESAAREEGIAVTVKQDYYDEKMDWEKNRLFVFGPGIGSNKNIEKMYSQNGKEGRNPFFVLSLASLFDIPDPKNTAMLYPSIEAFLAAMKIKIGTNGTVNTDEFTIGGSLYGTYLSNTQKIRSGKHTLNDLIPYITKYTNSVREKVSDGKLAGIPNFDLTNWTPRENEFLEYALKYRFDNDPEFQAIIQKTKTGTTDEKTKTSLKNNNLYLLYTAYDDLILGGKYSSTTKRITGANRVGKYLMKLANYTPLP